MRRWLVPCLPLALLPACTDDTTATDNDSVGDVSTMETMGDASTGDASTSNGDVDTSTDGSTDGDTTTGETDTGGEWPVFTPFDQADWARGDIQIDRIEVNQGIALTVFENGQTVDAPLVKDRNSLVQVFWSVPGNWQPRPIKAKLHLRGTNGGLDVLEVTKTISGAPMSGSLDGAITFQVPAQAFQGNLEYFVELWEGEGGHDNIAASSASPSAPAGGMQPIGVTTEPMEAKIWIVPVKYDAGNCHKDTTSIVSNNLEAFADHFYAQNPIHTLHIQAHPETLIRDTPVTSLLQITNMLVTLRFNDFAEPNEYYFAVLDACTGGIDGAGGISPGTPGPTKGTGDQRVSVGLWISLDWSMDTFVHELGHNQGRPHSPCGGPDGPDENYPHANASIGVYGFNILSGQWYSPSNRKDYMSYCTPAWVSDWTWGWVHEQVRQLTSWDYGAASAGDDDMVEVLQGWVHPSGLQSWWTSPGEVPKELLTTAESVAFYDQEGGLIAEQPAASWLIEDGKSRYYMVEVPDSDLPLVGDIVRISKDVERVIPRGEITRYFDATDFVGSL